MTKKKTTRKPSPASLALAALKHNEKEAKKKRGRPRKPGSSNARFTEARQTRYFEAIKEHGEPDLARDEVGITYETVRLHRKKTPGFAEAEEEALRIYRARLAAKVHERGYEGVQEAIYWQGMVVGWVTKYSDRMLELQVKRHIPEYRDKVTVQNEHSGSIGLLSDLSQLPAEIRGDLKKVLKKLAEHKAKKE